MGHSNFAYAAANDAGLQPTISIFADRPHVRDQMLEDGLAAGLRVVDCGDVAGLLAGAARPLGEVVMLDCPQAGMAGLAALSRLDMRAAHAGVQLIVATSPDSLEDVFACLDQSNPEILVDPSRAERVIALGRTLARAPDRRLRELSEEDRLTLLRLTEQVSRIAERLQNLGPEPETVPDTSGGKTPGFESSTYRNQGEGRENLARAVRPALPDARLLRRIIRQRQLRARFFDAELFADPAWDILLDLTAAHVERRRVSVTSLCIAAGVPPTTALRWIGQMTETGLLERAKDETDRRRAFVMLSDKAADGMAHYFAALGADADRLV